MKDIRWNNAGLIGGRALLDMLKSNMTLSTVEVAGNEIASDLVQAIGFLFFQIFYHQELALERNRQLNNNRTESTERANYLAATFQQLSADHGAAVTSLRSKLVSTESETQLLGQKLELASEEIESTQTSFKLAQIQLHDERSKRERWVYLIVVTVMRFFTTRRWQKKSSELEEALLRERKEYTDRCQSLLHDLMAEKSISADVHRLRASKDQLEHMHEGFYL